MTDNITKTILIDVQLKADQITQDLPVLANNIARLTAYQKEQAKAGKQGTLQFQKNAQDLRELNVQYREANRYIDNVSKARNAENNSIAQNRALISALTADYIKLEQTEGKTSASTIKLADTIKNLNTKLTEQEGKIGQSHRTIGKYSEGIQSAIGAMGIFSPAASSMANKVVSVANSFNIMGNASKKAAGETAEAGAAIESTTASITGTVVAALAVITFFGAIGKSIASLTPNAEALKRTWSGLGGVWRQFIADLADNTQQTWSEFFDKIGRAYTDSKKLTQAFQDLARSTEVLAVSTANADATIADLQLKMRNRRNTPEQEKAYFEQIQRIATDSYQQRKKIADAEYDLAIRAATIGRNFTDEELRQLKEKGTAYAAYLDKIKGLANKEGAGTDLAAIAKAQEDQAAAERFNNTVKDRAQNRLDAQNARAEAAQNADLQKQEDIKQKIAEINSERVASITRELEFQQEAFGKEISSTDEHYRQLIFKEQKYISDAEKIKRNAKSSPKTKALADQEIAGANKNIKQFGHERYAASEKLLIEHNRAMVEIVSKGALDLKTLEIANIEDNQKREIAGIENQFQQRVLTYTKENTQYQDNINKLNEEIAAKAKEKKSVIQQNELQALKTTLNAEYALLSQNAEALIAIQKAKDKAIEVTNKKYEFQKKLEADQTAIIRAGLKTGFTGGNNNGFNKEKENAELQQAKDEQDKELSQEGITVDKKLLIVAQYEQKKKEIEDEYRQEKKAAELKVAEAVSNAALSIIGNNIKSSAQRAEVQMSKDKERELANTSLTGAQKLAIENKFRIKQGQEKVKEFKAEQKLAIAKTIIAGAQSVVEASPNPILMALAAVTAAAEIAVIASQKPPAFATGGQFVSDGRGAVLPGYSKTDNVNAKLRSGEGVVVSEAMRDPYARNLVSAVNVAFGGKDFSVPNFTKGYAVGGIVTDGNNSNRYYAQPQEGTQNLANSIAYSLINNFPPVVVDVKDVNNQQSIYAKTQNRVSL